MRQLLDRAPDLHCPAGDEIAPAVADHIHAEERALGRCRPEVELAAA
jgi:hypothetical protein